MFSDADLLGVPVRVIVSPRNLKAGCCEIAGRDHGFPVREPLDSAPGKITEIVRRLLSPDP